MCRLILAHGRFSTASILSAAVRMSEGHTADHEGPTRVHPNGWGAVWRDPKKPFELSVHRDVRKIADSVEDSPVWDVETNFLVVHVRHATLARNQGLECTHPLTRPGVEASWYFLHNGFMPTVYQRLGKARSEFDSAEYLEFLVPDQRDKLDIEQALTRLRDIPPGGTSGNSILVNARQAYVIHWTPEDTPFPRYFSMQRLIDEERTIVSSEVIPEFAPRERWEPLAQRTILPIDLNAR